MIPERYYIAKHKNECVRMASRSGGVFTAVSDEWLRRNGVIYGCILDDDFTVRHIKAETEEERNRMRGSKYVQSELADTFRSVKNDLDEGRWVLFSGTSCQVAGLKSFLGKEYEKLFCVNIVCHGVPSPKVWKDYLEYWQIHTKKKIIGFDFRDKKKVGWEKHIETVKFADRDINSKIFTQLFYQHRILRPSCYHCHYKSLDHPGDLTIVDA